MPTLRLTVNGFAQDYLYTEIPSLLPLPQEREAFLHAVAAALPRVPIRIDDLPRVPTAGAPEEIAENAGYNQPIERAGVRWLGRLVRAFPELREAISSHLQANPDYLSALIDGETFHLIPAAGNMAAAAVILVRNFPGAADSIKDILLSQKESGERRLNILLTLPFRAFLDLIKFLPALVPHISRALVDHEAYLHRLIHARFLGSLSAAQDIEIVITHLVYYFPELEDLIIRVLLSPAVPNGLSKLLAVPDLTRIINVKLRLPRIYTYMCTYIAEREGYLQALLETRLTGISAAASLELAAKNLMHHFPGLRQLVHYLLIDRLPVLLEGSDVNNLKRLMEAFPSFQSKIIDYYMGGEQAKGRPLLAQLIRLTSPGQRVKLLEVFPPRFATRINSVISQIVEEERREIDKIQIALAIALFKQIQRGQSNVVSSVREGLGDVSSSSSALQEDETERSREGSHKRQRIG